MGCMFGAICKDCGTKYKVRMGQNMLGFCVHCDKCGEEISGVDSFSLSNPYQKYRKWLKISELIAKGADEKAIESIKTKTEIKDEFGSLTGEQLYLYSPKSFLLIGSLQEFMEENGINEDKFSSFELFRRNIINPEIITFDELYERAKNIVNNPQVVIS